MKLKRGSILFLSASIKIAALHTDVCCDAEIMYAALQKSALNLKAACLYLFFRERWKHVL
jgi:hypothetical protein